MPTANLPLGRHCQFVTNDFDAMHQRLSTLLKPHKLRRLSRVPISGMICRASLGRISINLMRIGPAVDVFPGTLEDFYLVQIPVRGDVQISVGDDRLVSRDTMAAVLSPGDRLHLRWSNHCTQLIVQIPRQAMESCLARQRAPSSRRPLKFQAAFDLRRPAALEWRKLLGLTTQSLDQDGLLAREPVCAEVEDVLMSGLLAAQPHNYSTDLPERSGPIPYYVLRAERALHERMASPVTVSALADVAGVSERTLHDGFRRFRKTSPMAYLTTMRLLTARRRLQTAAPGATVAGIAAEVGFFQFGRFAGAYRQAFGELPSATLRAARGRLIPPLAPAPSDR